MNSVMHFQLVSLTGVKFDEPVYQVILPTLDGEISVFANHMPLVSVAVPGIVTIKRRAVDPEAQHEVFAIEGGIIEIGDSVRLLVDEATASHEVQADEARAALARARQLKAEAKDQVALEHAQALIDREVARLKLAELRRHRSRKTPESIG